MMSPSRTCPLELRCALCVHLSREASNAVVQHERILSNINNNNLQAFQLIVFARYCLNPSPVSQHALTCDSKLHPRGVR